jgi:hypothetical protein
VWGRSGALEQDGSGISVRGAGSRLQGGKEEGAEGVSRSWRGGGVTLFGGEEECLSYGIIAAPPRPTYTYAEPLRSFVPHVSQPPAQGGGGMSRSWGGMGGGGLPDTYACNAEPLRSFLPHVLQSPPAQREAAAVGGGGVTLWGGDDARARASSGGGGGGEKEGGGGLSRSLGVGGGEWGGADTYAEPLRSYGPHVSQSPHVQVPKTVFFETMSHTIARDSGGSGTAATGLFARTSRSLVMH